MNFPGEVFCCEYRRDTDMSSPNYRYIKKGFYYEVKLFKQKKESNQDQHQNYMEEFEKKEDFPNEKYETKFFKINDKSLI